MKNNTSHSAHPTRAHAHSHGRLTRLAAFFAAAVLATSAAHADKYRETIYLNDGTYYCGYIAKQKVQEGTFVVHADYCVREVSAQQVYVEGEHSVPVSKLSDEQRAWFCDYYGVDPQMADREEVSVGTIVDKSRAENQVRDLIIIENGDLSIKYAAINRDYELVTSQIREIRYSGNDDSNNGVDEIYRVKQGGTVRIGAKGTTEKRIMGKNFTVRTANGPIELNHTEVASIEKRPRNNSLSIIEQAPTRDCISLVGGEEACGYIVKRDLINGTITLIDDNLEELIYDNSAIELITSMRTESSSDKSAADEKYDAPEVAEPVAAPEDNVAAPEDNASVPEDNVSVPEDSASAPEDNAFTETPESSPRAKKNIFGKKNNGNEEQSVNTTVETTTTEETTTPEITTTTEETTSPEPTNNASDTFEALGGNVTTTSGSQDTDTTSGSQDTDTPSGFSNDEYESVVGGNASSDSATSTSTPSALPKGKIGVGGFTIDACPTIIDLGGDKGLTGTTPKDVVIESGNRITISGAETDIEIYRPNKEGELYRFKRGAGKVRVGHTTATGPEGSKPYFSAESGQVYVIYSPSVNMGWLIRAI